MNIKQKEKQVLHIVSSNSHLFFQSFHVWDNMRYDIADTEEKNEINVIRLMQIKQVLYNGAFYPPFLKKSIRLLTTLLWYHKKEETIRLLQCLVCPISKTQDMIKGILNGTITCHTSSMEIFEKEY
jgi:hypothetical protein